MGDGPQVRYNSGASVGPGQQQALRNFWKITLSEWKEFRNASTYIDDITYLILIVMTGLKDLDRAAPRARMVPVNP